LPRSVNSGNASVKKSACGSISQPALTLIKRQNPTVPKTFTAIYVIKGNDVHHYRKPGAALFFDLRII
jgi:hypothetical protein